MRRWTAADIPSQRDRAAIVTGANSGIGWHSAVELARKGGSVVMACRDRRRGEEALRRLLAEVPGAKAELADLDLADIRSVRAFASAFNARGTPLDVLVDNAGVMGYPSRRTTADGFEAQFGVNHLGHFALTLLLLPALARAAHPRVVVVSSIAHRGARMDFGDLQSELSYSPRGAYGKSKLANLLFAFELQRRADRAGLRLLSLAAHPGVAMTNIVVAGPNEGRENWRTRLMAWLAPRLLNTEARAALPGLYAATSPDVVPGGYYGPDGFLEMRGWPVRVDARPQANDEAAAARLWEISERLTGIAFAA